MGQVQRYEPQFRPFFGPKSLRFRKGKTVTLIAGFRCSGGLPGGVVLCADSYEGDGTTKTEINKLVEYRRDWCTVGFAGAGNDSDVIEGTIERIVDELDNYQPHTEPDIKSAIREALKDLPETGYPANLLLAVCPSDNPHAALFAIAEKYLHTVADGYTVRGVGSAVGFIAEQLYSPQMTLYQGVLLSVHLLRIGNKYVDGVDGPTRVLVLTDDGWLVPERVDKIETHERVFAQFDDALRHVYLPFTDTSITQEDFENRLTAFTDTIRTLRANHFEEFRDAHLSMAINDPAYAGDPYRTLPDDARSQFGPLAVHYHFGRSGVASASPAPPEDEFDDSQESEGK